MLGTFSLVVVVFAAVAVAADTVGCTVGVQDGTNSTTTVDLEAKEGPARRQTMLPIQCAANGAAYSYNKKSYNGPYSWSQLSMCCGGSWQSPVNIRSAQTSCFKSFRVKYSLFPSGSLQGQLYNHGGHTASMEFSVSNPLTLTGVPHSPDSTYILSKLHYHVGNLPYTGSEHLVDGRGYDAELHLVHYNAKYGSMDGASGMPDGLAVIAVFLLEGSLSPNTDLNNFISAVSRLQGIGKKIPIRIDPRKLLPLSGNFFTYQGSLTTPPCSESVRWIVMRAPLMTTRDNVRLLQMLPTAEGVPVAVHTNVRPPQPLKTRILEANFPCLG
ncbi:carbonic anhydrase 1-like [Haliotis cracherodii]|uniref:carbonic anhydrase 1-like n=1 Tax=Haliotis cracherodii TaxID=6455 RepID=UPI0039E9A7A8